MKGDGGGGLLQDSHGEHPVGYVPELNNEKEPTTEDVRKVLQQWEQHVQRP